MDGRMAQQNTSCDREELCDKTGQDTEAVTHSLKDEYMSIVLVFTRSLIEDRGRVTQSNLRAHIDRLPREVQKYHQDLITRQHSSVVIEDATNISHFVEAVETFSNFLNPALVGDAISEYGDDVINARMQAYSMKLKVFKETTTLEQFAKIPWKGDTPPGYKEYEVEIAEGRSKHMKMMELSQPKLWLLKKVFSGGKIVIYSIPREEETSKGSFLRQNSAVVKRQAIYDSVSSEEKLEPPTSKKNKPEEASADEDVCFDPKPFRFSQHAEKGVVLSEDRLEARRKNPDSRFDGGVYVATPLSGNFEFEMKVIEDAPRPGSLWLGIAQRKKGTHGHVSVPYVDKKDKHTCTWNHNSVYNNLNEQNQPPSRGYGYVNLDTTKEGDRLGMQITSTGDLSFTFNGKNQGIAARGVYSEEYDTYLFINLCDNCNAVRITRAVMTGQVEQPKPLKSTEIEFGLHPVSKTGIAVLDHGQYAQRTGSENSRYGVAVCSVSPLKPRAEFEVGIDECLPNLSSFKIGLRMLPANAALSQYDEQSYNLYGTNHCVWDGHSVCLYDARADPAIEETPYGFVYIHQGDRVGFRLSADGDLIFYHNDRSKGVAVMNIFQKFKEYDLYPLVCFSKDCTAVQVTKAGYKEEIHHFEGIKLAIETHGQLNFNLMHAVLLGVPRSGKSSLMTRLLGDKLPSLSPSTGVMDRAIQVEVKRSSATAAAVLSSSESLVPIWTRLSLDQETVRLLRKLASHDIATESNEQLPEQSSSPTSVLGQGPSIGKSPVEEMSSLKLEPSVQSMDTSASNQTRREEKFNSKLLSEIFNRAIRENDFQAVLDTSWLLYLTDTGGQIEFQEVLPLLVSGPSVFFIVFRFDQDLNKTFTVKYLHINQGYTEPYQSTMTVKEALLESLASIAAMHNTIFKKDCTSNKVPMKPKVIFVGTHTDLVDQSRIRMLDMQLQEMVKSTAFYSEDLVLFAKEDQLAFTVNNFSEHDEDFQKIRQAVDAERSRGEFNMASPSHWLIYSLVVRHLASEERIISIDKAFEVAKECGIQSREELNEVLWFLHNKMGVLRYFPECDGLQDIVILDPQLLFDKVTELIVDTFTFENTRNVRVKEDFKNKGIFPVDVLQQTGSHSQNKLLTPTLLIKLLEQLRIIVALKTDPQQFFIPCVLSHTPKSSSVPPSDVPPLVIVFKCGYIPRGLTGALIVYLLGNEMESEIKWVLKLDTIFKNQLSFRVGIYNDIVKIRKESTHFTIAIHCELYKSPNRSQPLDHVCNEIRSSIEKGLKKVTEDLSYSSDAEHSITFYCPSSECLKNLQPAEVHLDPEGVPCGTMWCYQEKNHQELPEGYKKWFAQMSQHGSDRGQKEPHSVPQLKDAFKVLLSVGSDWEDIACLLKIPNDRIKTIRQEYNGRANSCLREILSEWLKQTEDQPSWNTLAKIMDSLRHSKQAQEIRDTYISTKL